MQAFPGYNCIAWAARNVIQPWWPDPDLRGHWPIPERDVSVENFVAAFAALGYEPCDSGDYEAGYEKLALYVDANKEPTHMARQISASQWTSKLGNLQDIAHESLTCLEGHEHDYSYGTIHCFLRRRADAAT
jgi:hypothetical protein